MCTIMIGRYSSVHGQYISSLPDGRVVVRVGPSLHVGRPLSASEAAASVVRAPVPVPAG